MSENTKKMFSALIAGCEDRKTRKAWKRYRRQLENIDRQQRRIDEITARMLNAGRIL